MKWILIPENINQEKILSYLDHFNVITIMVKFHAGKDFLVLITT
jgi:hypothetical protein